MKCFDIGYPHSKTPRILKKNSRTIKQKVIAWDLSREYYDGDRENGYGGFRYDGRWAEVIPNIVREYGISERSTVLDVGCKKGFFLHDLKKVFPSGRFKGVENHFYPIENAMESIKEDIVLSPYEKLPFKDNEFDFVFAFASIYMLNLGGVINSLREIQRVGKGKSYVTLGAYNTPEEKELFQQWTLLGTTVLHVDEWLMVFEEIGYTGDYYFTTAKSLNLVQENGSKI
jgi:ubiquinone/menaquinone biosynthesis C-methylase UbiE